MASAHSPQTLIAGIFTDHPLAVLATIREGRPHASLLTVAITGDLRAILFITDRNTHKYQDISADSRVALLADNRAEALGLERSLAITAVGMASETAGPEREETLRLFLAGNPHLREFAETDGAALIRVTVERYIVVRGITEVTEWTPE